MPNDDSRWLSFEDPDNYARLREVFLRANYTVTGTLAVAGGKTDAISISDIPQVLERTADGRPIDTFMRLFLAKAPVPEDAVREAIAPMTIETWETVGLLRRENGFV